MQVHPLVHFGDNLRRGLAAHHAVEHTDGALVFAVGEVDVRRIMVTLVEAEMIPKNLLISGIISSRL